MIKINREHEEPLVLNVSTLKQIQLYEQRRKIKKKLPDYWKNM